MFQLSPDEEDDVLHAVDPNEVFPRGPLPDPFPSCSSSESDSGISEDPAVAAVEAPSAATAAGQAPPPTAATTATAPAAVYQVVYDLSSVKTEPGDIISIELGENQGTWFKSCIKS